MRLHGSRADGAAWKGQGMRVRLRGFLLGETTKALVRFLTMAYRGPLKNPWLTAAR